MMRVVCFNQPGVFHQQNILDVPCVFWSDSDLLQEDFSLWQQRLLKVCRDSEFLNHEVTVVLIGEVALTCKVLLQKLAHDFLNSKAVFGLRYGEIVAEGMRFGARTPFLDTSILLLKPELIQKYPQILTGKKVVAHMRPYAHDHAVILSFCESFLVADDIYAITNQCRNEYGDEIGLKVRPFTYCASTGVLTAFISEAPKITDLALSCLAKKPCYWPKPWYLRLINALQTKTRSLIHGYMQRRLLQRKIQEQK